VEVSRAPLESVRVDVQQALKASVIARVRQYTAALVCALS